MTSLVRDGYVLTLSCADVPGIVAAVAAHLASLGCNITDSQQFGDPDPGTFFMRVAFTAPDTLDLATLDDGFAAVAEPFAMTWRLSDSRRRIRTVLMVSRFGHCLNDLLFRCSIGALPIDIAAVVSNHKDFKRLARNYDVPFVHIPVTTASKDVAELQLRAILADRAIDLVVLARYMQVLSDGLCTDYDGRIINIHHSMLPSFKGARPYHQAYDRGVKFVGATAHYVTADLDEGPIIEQEIARIDHSMSADDVVALGRDMESVALARAVRWHAENRVLRNGARTVVFT